MAKKSLLHKVAAAMLYRFFDIGNPAASGHLLIKPELRSDAYATAQFTDGDGKAQKSQSTLGLHFIYKF